MSITRLAEIQDFGVARTRRALTRGWSV